jgi:hypothetical protein
MLFSPAVQEPTETKVGKGKPAEMVGQERIRLRAYLAAAMAAVVVATVCPVGQGATGAPDFPVAAVAPSLSRGASRICWQEQSHSRRRVALVVWVGREVTAVREGMEDLAATAEATVEEVKRAQPDPKVWLAMQVRPAGKDRRGRSQSE